MLWKCVDAPPISPVVALARRLKPGTVQEYVHTVSTVQYRSTVPWRKKKRAVDIGYLIHVPVPCYFFLKKKINFLKVHHYSVRPVGRSAKPAAVPSTGARGVNRCPHAIAGPPVIKPACAVAANLHSSLLCLDSTRLHSSTHLHQLQHQLATPSSLSTSTPHPSPTLLLERREAATL